MASFRQFLVVLYWDGNVTQYNGNIVYDENTKRSSIVVRNRMSYSDFLNICYTYVGAHRNSCRLSLYLLYQFEGVDTSSLILGDESLEMLYYLASINESYCGHILIKQDSISCDPYQPTPQQQQNISISADLGPWSQPCSARDDTQLDHVNVQERTATVSGFQDQSDDDCSSEHSEQNDGSSPAVSSDDDDSDDEDETYMPPPLDTINVTQRVTEAVNDEMPEWADEEIIDMYDPDVGDIRLGMYFKGKNELDKAIRLWNVRQSREIIIMDSNQKIYKARCYTRHGHDTTVAGEEQCNWMVRASTKNSLGYWRIYQWVPRHNCYGRLVGKNNRSLKSKTIAEYVRHLVEADVAIKVNVIQHEIEEKLDVKVSYQKAWHGRKKAIERKYGSWESNFNELPRYIAALKMSNPTTVVQWSHNENSSSYASTFKYVFWAFGPSIEAFQRCHPVICIDGTHLKGSYRGKLLTAVTKNANNYVLPIAYAIVDEETNDSWSWFLRMFRLHVANRSSKRLCVVSDRHRGIINALETLPTWQEPHAYHRYCLRHVRSNVMTRFNNVRLRRLVWELGSTTQLRKYTEAEARLRAISEEAWQYLQEIGVDKWTLLHDKKYHRWGNLTTNIAESMNNALKVARLLPIKACMEHTFLKTVEHFTKQCEIALNCNTPLPPRMWRTFTVREGHAQHHRVIEYDYTLQIYRVISAQSTNDRGGNDFTVKYKKHRCTCHKWQMTRFPCSHAISVCRYRGDQISTIMDPVYTTSTYREQYSFGFTPLQHKSYWPNPGWRLRPDPTKLTTSRGRRRARRLHNEMDVHYPDQQRPRRCTLCKQPGHNRTRCPNGQPSFD